MKKRDFFKVGLTGIGALAISEMKGLEYYPTQAGKKWAILYGTWCGSTRDAGVWISEGMDGIAQVFDVRENPDLSGYENIIIGGGIRSQKVSEELQLYIAKNKAMLSGKVRGLFAVCGNRMQPVTPEITKELIDDHLAVLCDLKTKVPAKVFLGRVTYGLMDEASRKMLQGFNMPEYDNLKRPECMDFGKEVLATVK